MPEQFNLVANLKIQADRNSLAQAKSEIKRELNSVAGSVAVKFDTKSASGIQQVTKDIAATGVAAKQAEAAMSKLASANQAASSSASTLSSISKKTTAELLDGANAAETFGRQIALAGRRFAAFTIATAAFFTVIRAVKDAGAEFLQFNLSLNKFSQVSGDSASKISSIRDEIFRLSTSLGVSSKELAEVSVQFRQAGLSADQTKVALEAIAKASVAPNFDSIKQTAEGTIAVFQQFGKDASQLKNQLGSMNAVAGEFAVEAGDLITAVQRSGGAFKAAGGDLNELLGLFTSVRATTRESAEAIATGLRVIFSRLQKQDTVQSLHQLGIELRYTKGEAEALGKTDLEGQFVGAYEAIRRLSEGLSRFRTTDSRFSQVVESLGGQRQISRIIPLIQEFGEAQKALNISKIGGASLDFAADKRQEAFATRLAKIREEFQQLITVIGDSKSFQVFFNILELGAKSALVLADALKGLIPAIAGIAAIKTVQLGGSLFNGLSTPSAYRSPQDRKKLASGGSVGGSGSGDTVPAMLTPGEFVLTKRAVQSIGLDRLNGLNSGKVKGFADGGLVGQDKSARFPTIVNTSAGLPNISALEKAIVSSAERLGFAFVRSSKIVIEGLELAARLPVSGKEKFTLAASVSARNTLNLLSEQNNKSPINYPKTPYNGPILGLLENEKHFDTGRKLGLASQEDSKTLSLLEEKYNKSPIRYPPQRYSGETLGLQPHPNSFFNPNDGGIDLGKRPINYLPALSLYGSGQENIPYNGAENSRIAKLQRLGLSTGKAGDFLVKKADEFNTSQATKQGLLGENGINNLAFDTQRANFQKSINEQSNNLLTGIKSQLKFQNPGIRKAELHAKALQLRDNAIDRNDDIIIGDNGRPLGLASLGTSGIRATRRQQILGSARDKFSKLGGLTTLGVVGGGLISSAIEPGRDRLDRVGRGTEDSGRFVGQSLLSGGLTGAATGAAIGSFIPVIGTTIGAVVGGLAGLTTSLLDSKKQIEDAKLSAAINTLSENLDGLAKGTFTLANVQDESVQAVVKLQEKASSVAKSNATGFFGGFDPEVFVASRQKELRSLAGGQVGGAVSALNKQAGNLALDNIESSPKDLINKLNTGFNHELIQLVADIRGVPISTVLREFTETIKTSQTQIRTQNAQLAAAIENGRVSYSFARLNDAVEVASLSFKQFGEIIEGEQSLIEGNVKSRPVSGIAQGFNVAVNSGGPISKDITQGLSNLFGKKTGKDITDRVSAINDIKAILPSALAQVVKNGPDSDLTSSQVVRKNLEGVIGANAKNPIFTSILTQISGKIGDLTHSPEETKKFIEAIKVDPGKEANEILKPLLVSFQEITKSLELARDASNHFVEGLNFANQKLLDLREQIGKISDIRLEGQRSAAGFAAERQAKLPIDLLSLKQLQAPFENRLKENIAGAGANPQDISRTLDALIKSLPELEKNRDSNLAGSDAFIKAAKKVADTNLEINGLTAGLKAIADGGRLGPLQEKLQGVQSDRFSKQGFAKNFILSSPEQQFELRRGQDVLVKLDQGITSFKELSDIDKQIALRTADALGQTKLPSGRRASEFGNKLASDFAGIKQSPEELTLIEAIKKAEEERAAAQQALVGQQTKNIDTLISSLENQNKAFLSGLKEALQANALAGLKSEQVAANIKKDALTTQSGDVNILRKVGIKGDGTLQQARGQSENIRAFLEARENVKNLKTPEQAGNQYKDKVLAGQDPDLISLTLDGKGRSIIPKEKDRKLRDFVSGLLPEDVPEASRARIENSVRNNATRIFDEKRQTHEFQNGRKSTPEELAQISKQSIAEAVGNAIAAAQADVVKNNKEGLEQREKNVNKGFIQTNDLNNLSTAEINQLINVLNTGFKESGSKLSDFQSNIGKVNDKLAELQAQIQGVKETFGGIGGPERKAGGGAAMGTDTVPAMLTPEEFVVNRASAKANIGLLRHINNSKGPVRLAEGGLAEEAKKRDELYKQLRQYQAKGVDLKDKEGIKRIKDRNSNIRQDSRQNKALDRVLSGDFVKNKRLASTLFGPQNFGEALGVNTASSQALIRGSDRPGEAGQTRIASQAFANQRAGLFLNRYESKGIAEATDPLSGKGNSPAKQFRDTGTAYNEDELEYFKNHIGEDPYNGKPFDEQRFATGGMVGGSGSGDTVPALLTPGEFVLNKRAAASIGFNKLNKVNKFAAGGPVGKPTGGPSFDLSSVSVRAMEQFYAGAQNLSTTMIRFNEVGDKLSTSMTQFNTAAATLSEALQKFPTSVNLEGRTTLEVVVNGAEAFGKAKDEFQIMLKDEVKEQIEKYFKNKLPDA